MKSIVVALLLGTVCLGGVAAPRVEVCRDAAGRPIIGDTAPATCTRPSESEVERSNLAKEAAARAQEEQRKQERAAKALLAKYPDDATLSAARDRELKPLKNNLADSRKREATFVAARKTLEAKEVDFYKPPNVMPPNVQRMVDASDAQIAAQRAIIAGNEHDLEEASKIWDDRLARLRTLWAKQTANR